MTLPGDDKTQRQPGTMPLTPPGDRTPSGKNRLLGQIIEGRFKLRIVLGEGGMGKVYLAEDQKLNGRRVALKLMGAGLTMDPEFRARFEREAVLQANLPHPQIIQILDMGECSEGAFIVMEYSEGRSLSHIIKELGPLPVERALDMTEQILEVLDFAHRQGVVHRDLKPANILIEERPGREVVRLLDFGIAKLLGSDSSDKLAQTLTRQGFAYGTLGYMSPEQAHGELDKVDHRVDIYAAGIILHEMLTGQVPAPPESRTHPVRYAMWVAENKVKRLSESHPQLQVSEQVDHILQTALSRDPDERYQSALAFRNAIREFRSGAEARTVARRVDDTLTPRKAGSGSAASAGSKAGWVVAALLAAVAVAGFWMYVQERNTASKAQGEMESIRATFAELEFPSDDLNKAIRNLKGKLWELERNATTATPERIATLEGEQAVMKEDLQTARQERDRIRGELGSVTADRDTARKELSQTKKQLETAERDLEGLRKDPSQAALATANQELESLRAQVTSLTEARSTLLEKLSDWTSKDGERQEELSNLRFDKERLEREKTVVEKERDELLSGATNSQAAKALQERATRLETAKTDLERRISEKDQKIGGLEADVRRLNQDVVRLQNQGVSSQELEGLRRQEASLRSSLSQANQRIQDLERQLSIRNAPAPPIDLRVVNKMSLKINVLKVTARGGGQNRDATLPSDGELYPNGGIPVTVPGDTQEVLVEYEEYDYGNKRFRRPAKENRFVLTPGARELEIR